MENENKIEPILQPRKCGGWLAISPLNTSLRIGVTGNTEAEAEEGFHRSWDRWIELLSENWAPPIEDTYRSNMSDAMNIHADN